MSGARAMKSNLPNQSTIGGAGGTPVSQTGREANGGTMGQQTNPIPTTQPTDSYIPKYLSDLVPELGLYEKLIESEKRIDVYLARKKIDLRQSVSQWNNSKTSQNAQSKKDVKYLRVYVSNIAEDQPWQNPEKESSDGTWTMRIEGRLLDNRDVQDPERPKFSSFLQAIAVDFKKPKTQENNEDKNEEKGNEQDVAMAGTEENDAENMLNISMPLQLPGGTGDLSANGDSSRQPKDGNQGSNTEKAASDIADAVEWHFDPKNPVEFDGLDIKRPGSENVDCTITIQPQGLTGDDLEYSPDLAALIGISHGSLHEALYSLYKYILMNNLLINDVSETQATINSSSDSTKGEKTMVQLDAYLQRLLPKKPPTDEEPKTTILKLSEIPPLINAHISPIPPIKIDYTIRVDKASTYGELVFDLEVPGHDPHSPGGKPRDELAEEGISLLADFNKLTSELQTELQKLDARTNALQLQLNASSNRYQFYHKLSQDPVRFLQDYMASMANALRVLSGDERFNEDSVRRSQFYKENQAMLFENLGVLLANGRM
ncbi:hypothetical protein HG536_0A08940 [Torulaspora globosa]|uniref:DM2 domain-containing protein n=1 Tax=Torulaspora globosa TaxID=48254 RepID=A0A7G3ZC41_9SACH|nr:uncharacterized protein HG536_0A08940 [Torulaspora globosa]QLL31077.1 hypothetical protein HG536_0A08940 [Torulaspora globosa]